MAAGRWAGSLRDMVRKYGRVAVGVHLSVSGLCFSGCYLAILSSVDVEGILEKAGLGAWLPQHEQQQQHPQSTTGGHTGGLADTHVRTAERTTVSDQVQSVQSLEQQNESQQLPLTQPAVEQDKSWSIMKGGGAFALAWICNKALFPVRVPITIGLTPPIWRFLTSKGFRV